jgi:hypothetical protein
VIPPIALLGYLYSPLFGRRDAFKVWWLTFMVCGNFDHVQEPHVENSGRIGHVVDYTMG